MATPDFSVEFELATGVWTDVTPDVLGTMPLTMQYGILNANGPLARVFSTGTAELVLRNDAGNSGGLQGYYSPNHTNVRTGFDYGIAVRISAILDDLLLETGDAFLLENGDKLRLTSHFKFRGRIAEIVPMSGQVREQRTVCRLVDWAEDFARFMVRDVVPQASKRVDELLTTIINTMPTAAKPASQTFDVGKDTYPVALHDLGAGLSGRAVAQRLMQSELGQLIILGNGELRLFNRHHRATAVSQFTVDNSILRGLSVPSTLDATFNRVLVEMHPARIDSDATTVLWSLPVTPTTIQPSIPAGESRTFSGTYFDPTNEDKLIGGAEQVTTLEADTDFKLASSQGTGNDLNADASFTVSEFVTTWTVIVSNTGTTDGFLAKLQIRGKGIYDVAPMTFESSSVQGYGERSVRLVMRYQDDPNVAQGAADYLQAAYGALGNQLVSLSFLAATDTLITQALTREPGDKITVTEEVTGLATVEAFINGVEIRFGPGTLIHCTWHLAPAVDGNYWILGDAVASLLGTTTVLGYV